MHDLFILTSGMHTQVKDFKIYFSETDNNLDGATENK